MVNSLFGQEVDIAVLGLILASEILLHAPQQTLSGKSCRASFCTSANVLVWSMQGHMLHALEGLLCPNTASTLECCL